MREIKRKIVVGTGVFFLVKIVLLPIGAAVGIALSRILEPVYFGIFGILSFLVFTSSQLGELGFGAFLVQKNKEPEPDDYKTVFTLRLAIAVFVFVLLWFLSPILTRWFNLTRDAIIMIRVMSFAIFAEVFSCVSRSILQRKLAYKKIGAMDIVNAMTYQVSAIILALAGFKAWTFVFSVIASSLVTNLSYFILAPWRMGIGFKAQAVKEVFRFGSFFQLSYLSALLRDNIIAIFGGLAFGPQAVGYLSWAYNITLRITGVFNQVIGSITFPAISRMQDSPDKAVVLFVRAIRYLVMFTSPLIFIFLSLSYEITVFIFKPKWLPALFALFLFGMHHLLASFTTVGDNTLKGLGAVKEDFKIMSTWTLVSWLLAFLSMKWLGFNAIAFGWCLSTVLPVIWIVGFMQKIHPFSLKPVLLPMLAAAMSALFVFSLKQVVPLNIVTVMILGVCGICLYVYILVLLEGPQLKEEAKGLFVACLGA